MKGKIRKLLSVVVATAMTLSCLSVPALGAQGDVSQQKTATMVMYSSSGRSYNAYQIFTGTYSKTDGTETLSNVEWGASVNTLTLQDAVINALKADTLPDGSANPVKSLFSSLSTSSDAQAVSRALSQASISNNSTNADALAAIFADTLKSNRAPVAYASKELSGTVSDNNVQYQFGKEDTGLVECGYYVIDEVTDNDVVSATNTGYSKYILKVDGSGVSITQKTSNGPTLSKVGTTNSDYTTGNDTQLNAAIGDTVYFTLNSTVPDTSAYTKYIYVVNDNMTKGLDFNDDVVITVGETTLTAGDKGANDYTLTTTENSDGSTSLKIVFNDFANKWTTVGQAITIKYSATLNEDFVCGSDADNYNAADLTYSNNPNYQYKGTTDNPYEPDPEDENEPTKTTLTPSSTVYIYSAKFELIKTDESGTRLPNAEFTITGNNLNTVVKVEDAFEPVGYSKTYTPKDGETLYVKHTDGVFTTYTSGDTLSSNVENSVVRYSDTQLTVTDPNGIYVKKTNGDRVTIDANTDLTAVDSIYETDALVYTLTQEINTEKKAEATNGAYKLVLDEDNAAIYVEGLSAGTYTITETKSPDGYSLLANPIQVEISWTKATTLGDSCTWAYTVKSGDIDSYKTDGGEMCLKIVNKSGAMLPTTGGIGTTIFYVAGTILVLGAAVALITRRRMKGEVK
jgi:fimbrial isopeptide formation D2 family protein/LPXTG-motif cell wall-anchored protein